MDSWRAMVSAQGGNPDAPLAQAWEREEVRAEASGYVSTVDAYAMGIAAWRLGAGRARKEDPVSAAAGVILHRRPGDEVRAGDVLYELRADDPGRIPAAIEAAREAVHITDTLPVPTPLILSRIS
jgi:thymidine phosphorylase